MLKRLFRIDKRKHSRPVDQKLHRASRGDIDMDARMSWQLVWIVSVGAIELPVAQNRPASRTHRLLMRIDHGATGPRDTLRHDTSGVSCLRRGQQVARTLASHSLIT